MVMGVSKSKSPGKIGIIVSGGPAPGINGVISAAVSEACNRNVPIVGIRGGFRHISHGVPHCVVELNASVVAGIHSTGGSILGTSRFNPLSEMESQEQFLRALAEHEIDKLIVIGGEGSAYVSYNLSQVAKHLQIVHVPKTIDNDLILPNKYPSFGFETARYIGTNILETLMTDAETCERWFLVTSMGRKAGFLALGLGVASAAPLTLIPEEFADSNPTPEHVARIIYTSIKKRYEAGNRWGVAILAEGILDMLDPSGSAVLENCPRDEMGRIRYSLIELGDVLLPPLRKMLKADGISMSINVKNLGYELRCHRPVSFDIEYTTFLGYGAVKLLEEGHSGIMVTRDFDQLGYQPLAAMMVDDGSVSSRTVDLSSDLYNVCRSFMTR